MRKPPYNAIIVVSGIATAKITLTTTCIGQRTVLHPLGSHVGFNGLRREFGGQSAQAFPAIVIPNKINMIDAGRLMFIWF